MGWRVLFISKKSKLSLRDGQLLLDQEEAGAVTLPLEDIAAVVVDAYQSEVTGNLLSAMAANGIAYYSCDERHIPNGVFLPFHTHSRFCQTAQLQKDWSEPFKKRVWQRLVRQKIINQGRALEMCGRTGREKLDSMANAVQSGDAENMESSAALFYWKSLFDGFSRGDDADPRNKALNYGYAIIRGAVARALCAAGLLPCFGVFHHSELNAFNLADDLLEPFRPFVDCEVSCMAREHLLGDDLAKPHKQRLVAVLGGKCRLGTETVAVLSATEQSAFSLASCTREQDFNRLVVPSFRSDARD